MVLSDFILKKIQDEILNDPTNRGYASKNPEEITLLLNIPKVTVTPIIFHAPPPPPGEGDVIGEEIATETARVAVILNGVAETPNVLSVEDVTAAMKLKSS